MVDGARGRCNIASIKSRAAPHLVVLARLHKPHVSPTFVGVKIMKRALPIFLVSTLVLCLVVVFALPNSSQTNDGTKQNSQEAGTHPALKQDLVSESGEKILEVVEATYQTTPDSLDSSSIRVRNLSGRNITAVGMVWTVTLTGGKTCQLEQLVDYRIHNDIANEKGVRPVAPYEEKSIPRLTKEPLEEGQRIQSVRVEVAFVEFEDSSGVSIEKSEMYKHLLRKREGAEIYKRWVEEGYEDNPRRIGVVVGKLSGDELPNDDRLGNAQVKQGALVYKQWMLGILKDRGVDALQERLHIHQQLRKQR
jgi:hypothetical protein